MTDKYIQLNRAFPNKAGALLRIITAQKRMVENLARTKQPEEIKNLLTIVAEGHDVANDLMGYMKATLQEVADDSIILIEGAKTRRIIETQAEEILRLWEKI
jgi:hypothetical protein